MISDRWIDTHKAGQVRIGEALGEAYAFTDPKSDAFVDWATSTADDRRAER